MLSQEHTCSDINLQAFFAPSGTLSKLLPGYQQRPEQGLMAQTITRALFQEHHALIEAGTGVGKSLAYLVPGIDWALAAGERLLVSTHTKALQNQLMDYELPRLACAGVFPRPFHYEICLGAENYICLIRLLRAGEAKQTLMLDQDYVESLKALLPWCQGQVSGLRSEAPFSVPEMLWQQVHVIKELCLGRKCAFFSDCFLTLARQRQREADVLVTNHSLFFSHLVTEGRLLPEFGAVILDEAHKVEDVATRFLGKEISQNELHQLLAMLAQKSRNHPFFHIFGESTAWLERISASAQKILSEQETWWQKMAALFPPLIDTLRWPAATELAAPASQALQDLGGELMALTDIAEREEDSKIVEWMAVQVAEAGRNLDVWYRLLAPETVYWAEKNETRRGSQITLMITPLEVGRQFRKLVLDTIPRVIFLSASIAVKGDFSYFRSRLGIIGAEELVLASPFNYQANTAIYLPKNLPDPRETEAFAESILQEVQHLIELFDGGLFVLFTNYRLLKEIARALKCQADGRPILVQGEGPPGKLLKQFREHERAVLLGVETFWQGVDVPGDALRCVAITRLPFDVPTHPVHQARAEKLAAKGYNPFIAYSLPRAVLMLRQGFGRLIRGHQDRGVVAILDPRVVSRRWGKQFLEALPPCQRLRESAQVRKFIAERFQ